MIKSIVTAIAVSAGLFLAFKFGYRNIEDTKAHSVKTWNDAGFQVVGYEGFQWGPVHGGAVWHIVKRAGEDHTIYHGYVAKWGNEYHIYNLNAINAIEGTR